MPQASGYDILSSVQDVAAVVVKHTRATRMNMSSALNSAFWICRESRRMATARVAKIATTRFAATILGPRSPAISIRVKVRVILSLAWMEGQTRFSGCQRVPEKS